jgi:hypothetical protein
VDEQDPVTRARRRLQQIGGGYVELALAEAGLFLLLFTVWWRWATSTPTTGSARR